jgi:class 3 adenylate cyclase
VDGIVVGKTTYRATAAMFEFREAEPVQAKGKAGRIPIWVLLRETQF